MRSTISGFIAVICFILLLMGSNKSVAANRYWIAAGSGNWNSLSNWSTSSGGTGGASVPASTDIAIFDASGNGSCNITTTISVLGIQINGYSGTISQNSNSIVIGSSGFSQNSGVFSGGSAVIDLNSGLFAVSGGTFQSTSSTFYIGGTWGSNQVIFNHSAGVFLANNGTVVFDPFANCYYGSYTIDVIPATSFYDLSINAGASCSAYATITTGSGDLVAASNNFTCINGAIAGAFTFTGNLNIGSGTDGGSGTITASGSGAQTYSVDASSPRTCIIEVNKTAGALTPAVGTTDLSVQGFYQTLGDFTAPSGNFSVGGTWGSNRKIFNHAGGVFSHNNGTVIFDPFNNCFWGTYTVDVDPTTTFYNVSINGNGSCSTYANITTGSGDVVAAANDLMHTDGYISGQFSFANNLIIGSATDGGTGTITAVGTGAQTYSVAASAPRTCVLGVNKPSGALTPAVGTTDLTVQGFNQVAGDFTAPTGSFSIGGTWSSNTRIFNHSTGAFSHNNGTIIFDPFNNCFWGTYTVDVDPTTTFYNVSISGSGSCSTYANITTGSGDVVAAANDLMHTDGYISGQFSFANNLLIGSATDGGTGTITAVGTGAQTYSVAASAPRTCVLGVNKPSGALTPAVGTTDLTVQGFSQVAGDFTAPTGTFSIGGTWSSNTRIFNHSAGTFSHNNGTIIFDPFNNCFWGTYTVDVIPATALYNVIVNGNGSCSTYANITTGSGDVVAAANDLMHTDGYISGQFSFANNLLIGSATDGGTGTITAVGTGAQTYSVAASAPRTCVLGVNKPSGALTPAVGTTDLTVQGFNQMAGDFTAPTGSFSIGGTRSSNTRIFNHNAGTFSHNNGTIIFDPFNNCFWGTYTVDVIATTTFNTVYMNGNGSCGTFATIATGASDVVYCNGDFIHNDGYISGSFSFAGNLQINASSDSGSGTLTATGGSAQTYSVATSAPRTCVLAVNKTSGSLGPAVGNTQLLVQGFNQVAGDFTAPTGSFSIGGTWGSNTTLFNHSAGTFSHNNGIVVFEPYSNCFWGTYGLNVIPSTSFNSVLFNGGGSCGVYSTFSVAANDTLDAMNTLTLSNGAINSNYIACQGTVYLQSGYDGGNSSLVFTGSGASAIDATGATSVYDGSIRLAKSNASKSVTLLSGLVMNGTSQSLVFSKGQLISTSLNLLEIGDNVTTSGGSDSSYVSGPLMKTGNDAFFFPVGGTSAGGSYNYAPIGISAPNTTTAQYTAEYFLTSPDPSYSISLKDVTLDHISSNEYWILNRTTSSANVSVSLTWTARSGGVTQLSDLRVARWDGSQWTNQGNGGTTGSTTAGTVISAGVVTAFSPFALSSINGNNPLPVDLVEFKAYCNGAGKVFEWRTLSEKNSRHFYLQGSTDGNLWRDLGHLEAAGTTTEPHDYQLVYKYPDTHVFGESYFRLKQVDSDFSEIIYNIIYLDECNDAEGEIVIYPIPVTDVISIHAKGTSQKNIRFYSGSGQEQYLKLISEGDHIFRYDTSQLPHGVYYIVTGEINQAALKFIK